MTSSSNISLEIFHFRWPLGTCSSLASNSPLNEFHFKSFSFLFLHFWSSANSSRNQSKQRVYWVETTKPNRHRDACVNSQKCLCVPKQTKDWPLANVVWTWRCEREIEVIDTFRQTTTDQQHHQYFYFLPSWLHFISLALNLSGSSVLNASAFKQKLNQRTPSLMSFSSMCAKWMLEWHIWSRTSLFSCKTS